MYVAVVRELTPSFEFQVNVLVNLDRPFDLRKENMVWC